MADNEIIVTSAGPALSLLFYENIRTSRDQIGFLLGDVSKFVTKSVTDSAEKQVESVTTHIDLKSVLPCSINELLENACGRINKTILNKFTEVFGERIIGWYRFRMENSVPTFTDKIIHKQLNDYFSKLNKIKENYFVFCMLSYQINDDKSIHKFKNIFLRYNNGAFQPIPLKINNLGKDVSKLDDYKLSPVKLLKNEDFFTEFTNTLQIDFNTFSGEDLAKMIMKEADTHLTHTIPNLLEDDEEVSELLDQVEKLKNKIRAVELCKFKRDGEMFNQSVKKVK